MQGRIQDLGFTGQTRPAIRRAVGRGGGGGGGGGLYASGPVSATRLAHYLNCTTIMGKHHAAGLDYKNKCGMRLCLYCPECPEPGCTAKPFLPFG